MGTTVWVDADTRDRLRTLQGQLGLASVNETIQHLLARPAIDARTLFRLHDLGIKQILRKHRLADLVAFGSRARGDATATSDLDLAVRILDGAHPLAILSAESDLEDLLGVQVRIVERPHPVLEDAIRREGVVFGS